MDTSSMFAAAQLSDQDLLARVRYLAHSEREATAALIAHLAVLDERRLYLSEGYSSLFLYCTQVLRLSEHAAYGRITAARIARRHARIFQMLTEGSVNLTTLCLLGPHLNAENRHDLLERAKYKSKRKIQELLATVHPQPAAPSSVRRLPTRGQDTILVDDSGATTGAGFEGAVGWDHEPALDRGMDARPGSSVTTPARAALIAPLAPHQYKVQFTASTDTIEKLRLAQALLRHQIPDGDPAQIFDRALTALLQAVSKQKTAATARPRREPPATHRSRHIPATVKRAVWLRDAGQCAFVSRSGRRCDAQEFLEYHHVRPYSAGGQATVDNIQLRCRAHNSYEATQVLEHRTQPGGFPEAPPQPHEPMVVAERGPAYRWRPSKSNREAIEPGSARLSRSRPKSPAGTLSAVPSRARSGPSPNPKAEPP